MVKVKYLSWCAQTSPQKHIHVDPSSPFKKTALWWEAWTFFRHRRCCIFWYWKSTKNTFSFSHFKWFQNTQTRLHHLNWEKKKWNIWNVSSFHLPSHSLMWKICFNFFGSLSLSSSVSVSRSLSLSFSLTPTKGSSNSFIYGEKNLFESCWKLQTSIQEDKMNWVEQRLIVTSDRTRFALSIIGWRKFNYVLAFDSRKDSEVNQLEELLRLVIWMRLLCPSLNLDTSLSLQREPHDSMPPTTK